jgi:MSHA biogenesis protein MshQ
MMRVLQKLFLMAGLLLASGASHAVNYVFPGTLPAGCSGSGPSYTCTNLNLGFTDTLTVNSPKPATINVTGSVSTNFSSINASGATADLTFVVGGTFALGFNSPLTANVTAGSFTDSSGSNTIKGSITTTGNLTVGFATTVTGDLTSTTGAITASESSSVGGKITSTSGAVSVLFSSTVTGSVTTAGAVTLFESSRVGGAVNAGTGAVWLKSSAVAQGGITTSSTIQLDPFAESRACTKSTSSASIFLDFGAKANSVCCGSGACTNSCVTNNSSSAMPPLCAGAGPDHYELTVPTSSISCLASNITVTACANASSPCTSKFTGVSGKTATLATSSGSLSATTVTFNASGDATASLSFPTATNGATAAVTLSGEQTAATNPRKCCAGASCSVANSCTTTFNTAGFVFTNAAGAAATNIGTQTAGTTSSSQILRAVRTSTSTQACEAALVGSTSVNFAYECNNPSTCSASNLMTVTGSPSTVIQRYNAGAVGAGTPLNLTFDANGNAPFTFNFLDVGRVTLWATKSASGSLLSGLSGSSNGFVVKPSSFVISNIKRTASPFTVNPAASTNLGALFVKAGEPFTLTVTSLTSSAPPLVTPNFGKESTPEVVRLTPTLVLPSGGNAGVFSNGDTPLATFADVPGSAFVNGVATVTNLNWSEVGVLSLTPVIGDNRYIGTGNITGVSTGNIGRFYPNHFDMTLTEGCIPPTVLPSPAPPRFTYSGQPMNVTLTAKNLAGGVTTNYNGTGSATANFAKTITWANATVPPAAGGFNPAIFAASNFVSGVASGTATYAFTSARTAPSNVKVRATDSDGASTSGGIPEIVTDMRSGRLAMQNAFGSELFALPMPTTAQYWNGTAWLTNPIDQCTTLTVPSQAAGLVYSPVGFQNFTSPTMNTGSIAPVNAGSVATIVGGDARLQFSAPGVGNAGIVDVTVVAPTWLKFPWPGNAIPTNPTARATFGFFKSPLIYRRENY